MTIYPKEEEVDEENKEDLRKEHEKEEEREDYRRYFLFLFYFILLGNEKAKICSKYIRNIGFFLFSQILFKRLEINF